MTGSPNCLLPSHCCHYHSSGIVGPNIRYSLSLSDKLPADISIYEYKLGLLAMYQIERY
jgi:hypothetical protein